MTGQRPAADAGVLVVGAGPAGAVAALVLARAGVRVRIVDRASFPRDKFCGDTLNPGARALVERLGLGAALEDRGRPMTGMLLTGPGGARVTTDYPLDAPGWSVERRAFDLALLEAAIAAGADFVPGVHVLGPLVDSTSRVVGVRVRRGGVAGEVHARLVIAADGRCSKLAAALGLARLARRPKRWAFGAYFDGVDGLTGRGEMHVRHDGYTGVAPLRDGVANVCVVRSLQRISSGSRLGAGDLVVAATVGDRWLGERFARARRLSPVASLGPLAVEAIDAGCPGLLLAGDAAGFVDPMTGDGLRFALRGGELAADAALAELADGTPACDRLRIARRGEFSRKWRVNRALRALVAWPSGVAVAEAVAARWPAPIRRLVGFAGDLPPSRCARCHPGS